MNTNYFNVYFLNHFADSKSYLTTVMENDLIKPWKQSQLPPKRVSVPKKAPDFVTCTNEEPTTMECQGILTKYNNVIILGICILFLANYGHSTFPNFADSNQDNTVTTQKAQKRKSKDSSASPKTPKNQRKGNFHKHMNFYLTLSIYCLHCTCQGFH